MHNSILWIALAALLAGPFAAERACAAGTVAATALRCEYDVDPLGIDSAAPRLEWNLAGTGRALAQSAYQILAAASLDELNAGRGELWDSGKVAGSSSIHIPYGGAPLRSGQQVFWKVRVWDQAGEPSGWSAPATWTMGIVAPRDWTAKWIAAVPDAQEPRVPGKHMSGNTPSAVPVPPEYQTVLMRREFAVKPGLRRAVISICGLGFYELTANGAKVGDQILAPGWTMYDKTCLYDTYDITASLREGANALGIELGNGMYRIYSGGRYAKLTGSFGPLKAIAQLRLEYADGTSEIIATDGQWRVAEGPVVFSSIFGGEDYDARRAALQEGWSSSGFADATWKPALETQGPGGELIGHSAAAPPIRAIETLQAASTKATSSTTSVVDFGQNASIIPRLRVRGPAGSRVRMTPAELLRPDGTVDRQSSGGGNSWWQYTLAGEGEEEWYPKFFYHGARYVQVDLAPAAPGGELPRVDAISAEVVHAAAEPVGDFSCSNELFNRIYRLVRWSQRSNLVSVLTDCPHRERLGWLEQYHLNGPALRYNFGLQRLFSKGMNDMADSQRDTGLIADIAPEYTVFEGGFLDSPEWGSAFIVVPWQQYLFDGDLELFRRHFDAMKKYVAYLGTKATGHIVDHGLGDWYDLGPGRPGQAQLTPKALTATAFYFYDATILSQGARLLGREEDAKTYAALAEEIRLAFNAKFYDAAKGSYSTGSQTANAVPLAMGIVDEANRAKVLAALVADIRARDNGLTAGDVGFHFVLRALADGGRSDVIFDMNSRSDKPGYGYILNQGATALTEAWTGLRSSSQNHFMLGHINEWFYSDLAGIAPDPAAPGFGNVIVRPQPVGDVTWAEASHASVRGHVKVRWDRADGKFTLKISIPAGATATIFMPGSDIHEGGEPAADAEGVKPMPAEAGTQVFAVGSGDYRFESNL